VKGYSATSRQAWIWHRLISRRQRLVRYLSPFKEEPVNHQSFKSSASIFLSVFALVACQQNGQATDAGSREDAPDTNAKPVVQDVAKSPANDEKGMTYQEQMDMAQIDLLERMNITEDQVEVWEAVSVDWRSAALGCPKKGMNYTQALVPGFLIVLRVGETEHHYHARRGDKPFFCPPGRVEEPAPTTKNFIM
jgi:hypothetical protein